MKCRFLVCLLGLSLCGLLACSSRSTTTTGTGTGALWYATQGDSSLWAYTVTLSSGGLSQIGSPLQTGGAPFTIALTPALDTLFVDNSASDTISVYSVGSGGGLTAGSATAKTGAVPMGMAVDPAGKFLFVANQGSFNLTKAGAQPGSISVFSISGTTLAPVKGSPFKTELPGDANGTGPVAVVVSASGKFLYVSNTFTGTVSGFKIGSSGALTPFPTPPYIVGIAPAGMAITPGGAFLYVANSSPISNNVSAFMICDAVVNSCANPNKPDGTLTPVAGSPFGAGLGPVAIAVDPSFHFLYVINKQSNEISEYSYGTGTGVLSQLSTPTVSTGHTPTSLVIISGTIGSNVGNTLTNPTDFVYVTNLGDSTLSAYTLNTTTGVLDVLGQAITTTVNPSAIAAN
ncbi:MAG: beta-propeller fold lactonase family protein [Terriglobales bacterium]